MRILLLLICLSGMVSALAQDTATWKKLDFDGYATVMMPDNSEVYDSSFKFHGLSKLNIQVHQSKKENTVLFAFKSKERVMQRAENELEKENNVDDFLSGFTLAAMRYRKFIDLKDTTIDKIKCKRVEVMNTQSDNDSTLVLIVSFVDSRIYGVGYSTTDTVAGKADITKLIAGLRFTKAAVEKETYKRYDGVSHRELWIVLGATVVIIIFLIILRSLKRPKPKRRNEYKNSY